MWYPCLVLVQVLNIQSIELVFKERFKNGKLIKCVCGGGGILALLYASTVPVYAKSIHNAKSIY